MRMMVLIEVNFDQKREGVDSLSDAQAVAHHKALEALKGDEPEDVHYVVLHI